MLFELDNVSLTRGGTLVLRELSIAIPEGTTAVVGPSGSGKSSMLRLLNRLADPDSGNVNYLGAPIADRDVLALRREVMLVPQLPALIAGSVADNLRFAAEIGGRDQFDEIRYLEFAGLGADYAERDAAKLSVGEQQRAMLARALVLEPEVLLLDEPTSALDEAATSAVEEALGGLRERVELSIVLVTHDPAQASRLADGIVEIEPIEVAA